MGKQGTPFASRDERLVTPTRSGQARGREVPSDRVGVNHRLVVAGDSRS
jgi:hypothetical protein